MKKAVITIPLAILATLAVAGTVYANPSTATATCQGGIVYEGHNYPSSGNIVTVKIDGTVVAGFPKTFGTATSGTVPFPNQTSAHTWAVVWDRYNGTDGDRTQSGSVAACVEPTTTTVAPTTTVAVTTTTVAVTDPTTTTSIVDIGTPPVPTTTLAPAVRGEPVCEPDMPCWPCRDYPGYVCPAPVATVVFGDVLVVEPALPITGTNDTLLYGAALLVFAGMVLLIARRRV